jgi:DNA-binding NarL/FixJ family response regulator
MRTTIDHERPRLGPKRRSVIRTLIVDDSEAIRTSLVGIMAWLPRLKVIGTAGDGAQALALIAERRPRLVLMDLNMPVLGGLEATRVIRRRHPATRVVLMTIHDGAEVEARCRQAGADAFLSKTQLSERLGRVVTRLFGPSGGRKRVVGKKPL